MKRYLVMMLYSWGLGDTLAEADAKARSEGNMGRKRTQRIVWTFDPAKSTNVGITEDGCLAWLGEMPVRFESQCGTFGPERERVAAGKGGAS